MRYTYYMQAIIDTHCHLDFAAFDADRDQVLRACEAKQVSDIVIPAVSQDTWGNTIELCQTDHRLHLALGLHPIFIDHHQPQHLIELDTLVSQHPAVAIGEIGLDYYLKELDREKQRIFFNKQLIIAKQHQLPAIIHVRKAHDDCIKELQQVDITGGIIHNFSGSIQHAHKYIDMGFKLGFGGMLTFERSRVIRNLAKQIPLDAIVLETDAPDLTVHAHKGGRNSPEYLPFVLQSLAALKMQPESDVAKITSRNARHVLGL